MVTTKPGNYGKVKGITRGPDENPALSLSTLSRAFRRYTNQDLNSREGQTILAMDYISQSAPDIQRQVQKLEKGPQTPRSELVDLAFKVFNNRDEDRQEKGTRSTTSQELKKSFPNGSLSNWGGSTGRDP